MSISATPEKAQLTGAHVLGALVAFFAVVFAVNAVLLYSALSSHSGLVAQEPYRKGLAYNERIAASERQAALLWTAKLDVEPGGTVALSVVDAGDRPIQGLRVSGTIGRPATGREDQPVVFYEPLSGQYVATLAPLSAGAWRIDIEARPAISGTAANDDPVYRLRRRLWLKP